MPETLLLIEDDDLTREMLALLLSADGWSITEAASGDAALALVKGGLAPQVILSDLQMPGLSGVALAKALYNTCPSAKLLAMTATRDSKSGAGFDRVLLKPVTAKSLRSALENRSASVEVPIAILDLHEETYTRLAASMPPKQLEAFYGFALEDATRRTANLKHLAQQKDEAAFRAEAHALKGGCGMVGATRIHAIASSLERGGINSGTPGVFQHLDDAMIRLRSMLEQRFRS